MMISSLYNRIIDCNHQQWGHLIGMVVGFAIAIFSLPYLSIASLPWIGTLKAFPLIFIKIISIPFISGMFANLFANLGCGLDILTNNKTFFHLAKSNMAGVKPSETRHHDQTAEPGDLK